MGILRHMEIQRGSEGMKTAKYNERVEATAGCTLRLLENTIGVGGRGMIHGIRADAWFGSVRAANEIGIHGHQAVLQVKNNAALFPKAYIENALHDAPGGVHIVLKGITKDEVPLVALGYQYSRKTTLFFIATKNAGSTHAGTPYTMKYTDGYGNVCSRLVERPEIISNFFAHSNAIDTHNQLRQANLALEKKWLT
jgi:hypothetical protein